MKRQIKKYGQASLEFIAVVTLVLASLLFFQKYIARALMGRWKQAGDALGEGKIYSPTQTIECAYEFRFSPSPGAWYEVNCFYSNPNCPKACFSPIGLGADAAVCSACVAACYNPACEDDWGGT